MQARHTKITCNYDDGELRVEFLPDAIVNLRNRTGEERRRQTLCDKRDNNFI